MGDLIVAYIASPGGADGLRPRSFTRRLHGEPGIDVLVAVLRLGERKDGEGRLPALGVAGGAELVVHEVRERRDRRVERLDTLISCPGIRVLVAAGEKARRGQSLKGRLVDGARGAGAVRQMNHRNFAARRYGRYPEVHRAHDLGRHLERTVFVVGRDGIQAGAMRNRPTAARPTPGSTAAAAARSAHDPSSARVD